MLQLADLRLALRFLCLGASFFSLTVFGDESNRLAVGPFGGYPGIVSPTLASGYFRVERLDERWYLITPRGEAYFALGGNHVGRYLNEQAEGAGLFRRADDNREQAAQYLIKSMQKMGLNAGEAYAPLSPELQREFPWIANLDFPFRTKYKFDVFDPEVERQLRQSVDSQCQSLKENPMVIGLAFADLPVWNHRRVEYFESLPSAAPGKIRLEAARTAGRSDAEFLGEVADHLYALLAEQCAHSAPNHMFLGERFQLRDAPDEVLRSVGKHVDVFCTQALIRSPQRPPEWQVFQEQRYALEHRLTGRPLIIVDWAAPFSLTDAFDTEKGRLLDEVTASEQAADWLVQCASQPFIVGVFKCQLIGSHGNDRWFNGRAKRTYLQDDGTEFARRTAITRDAHRRALEIAYGLMGTTNQDP